MLRSESEAAPEATGLADAARSRARARRRTRLAVVGAAAVVVLAVPVAVVALGGDGDSGKAPVADNTDATDLEPVRRRPVGVAGAASPVFVPRGLGRTATSATWCAGRRLGGDVPGHPARGVVADDRLHAPASATGLSFQEIEMADDRRAVRLAGRHPDRRRRGRRAPSSGAHGEDGVLVTVAGPDHEHAWPTCSRRSRPYGGSDPHGCSPRVEDDLSVVAEGAMSVCRYDVTGELEQSELLDGADAADAAAALDSTVQGDLDCEPSRARARRSGCSTVTGTCR